MEILRGVQEKVVNLAGIPLQILAHRIHELDRKESNFSRNVRLYHERVLASQQNDIENLIEAAMGDIVTLPKRGLFTF